MRVKIVMESFVSATPVKPWKENFRTLTEEVDADIKVIGNGLNGKSEETFMHEGKLYKKAEVISCYERDYSNPVDLLLKGAYKPRRKFSDKLFSMRMEDYESREEVLKRLRSDLSEFLFVGEELYVASPSNLVLFEK